MDTARYCWLCGSQIFSRYRHENGLCDVCQTESETDDILLELFGFIGGEDETTEERPEAMLRAV